MKHWITLNEPYTYTNGGYSKGNLAPGRCSEWQNLNCTGGDSGIEPYLVSHHQLLSHAAAVKLYKEKYQVIKFIDHSFIHLANQLIREIKLNS